MEKKAGILGLKDFGKKVGETAKDALQKTQDISQRTAVAVQKGAAELSDKMKQAGYQNRLKKYNPLFPDVYNSSSFNIPNLIVIVDDAIRRGIDVCEGAIGWLGKSAGTEVLYLYDEAVESSGLTFVPTTQCDAIYYMDTFDRRKFVRVDCIFSLAHEDRLAELKHIAHALGAKRCIIDISEETHTIAKSERTAHAAEKIDKDNYADENYSQNISKTETNKQKGRIILDLVGNDSPQIPNLKWFAHDNNIKRLIDMRMAKGINSEEFELSGSSSATMSQKTAYAIDSAVKGIGAQGNVSMEDQAVQEHTRKIFYCLEF